MQEKQDKRSSLLFFSSVTLVLLLVVAVYFEMVYPHTTPFVVRVILTAYGLYSLLGIMVSRFGSDAFVAKMYLNVNREVYR